MHRSKFPLKFWDEHENGREGEKMQKVERKITLNMQGCNIPKARKCKTKNA